MDIKEKLSILPDKPGCYQMKDISGKVIYVGKAKNLKNRVKSYFIGSHDAKTTRLVSNIKDFEYIITNSELEALLLELNLIKKYNPRYNIMLTDDKSYPYISFTKGRHPRLIVTRTLKDKKSKFFGPYPNVFSAKETASLLNRLYPLRKCVKIPNKECLYHHLGQCLAPCIKEVDIKEYDTIYKEIKDFLNGKVRNTVKDLERKMFEASENLEFEKAKDFKDLINHIKNTTEKQKINLSDLKDRDIFGYFFDEDYISIDVFYIRSGKIVARDNSIFEYYGDALDNIVNYIAQFYEKNPLPKELFVPENLDGLLIEKLLKINVTVPKIGDKKKLVDLANTNAKESLESKKELHQRKIERTIGATEKLGEILGINTPYRIEAFDNSNIQGTNPVSAMVVFINGLPAKKEYRKYKIKTVKGPDDYNTMKEVVYRRYHRVLFDGLDKPDLIVVDGGKGQMNAAKEILDSINIDIPLIGLKKDDKHQTNTIIKSDGSEIKLNKRSNEFHLLTRIQDEAHRFSITFHKELRNKGVYSSLLDDIEGLGPKRKELLLTHFKTIYNMKKSNVDELVELGLNKSLAEKIMSKLSDI